VITHELSQIEPQDFIYVLKGGSVVEQGFRGDLEVELTMDEEGGKGEFRRMMTSQGQVPKSVPTDVEPEKELEEEEEDAEYTSVLLSSFIEASKSCPSTPHVWKLELDV
jgi:ATP-binding cassette subfamily B (MDR/TAP) protein 1